ncbi:hypothetical protein [Rubinisphaera italica]|uniref:Uncharacterized protein n=1 Tax=Rubinisphaera italica TaxID=2527969 RepID=A0A5C5XKB2_9PLAN|nr:hypothetical protein [Rubinisphaera italica]TWT63294.1 hypothetical protein Pan54_40470 [Rubinisphaera italica]
MNYRIKFGGAILTGLIGLLTTGSEQSVMAQKVIKVTNAGSQPVWVTVAFEKKNVVESDSGVTADREIEAHARYSREANAGFEGFEVGSKDEIDLGGRTRNVDSSFLKEKYDWSPFIEAGESRIQPGLTEEFGVSGDQPVYYITIRKQSGFIKVNVPKLMSVHNDLILSDGGYEAPRVEAVIDAGTALYLKSGNEYISKPYKHGTFGEAVAMHKSNAGVLHYIRRVNGQSGPIKNGDIVYLTVNPTSAYNKSQLYMHHGAYDNIYYTNNSNHPASKWEIIKVRNGSAKKDPYIRTNQPFLLMNNEHRSKGLSVDSNDGWMHSTDKASQWKIDLDL